MVETGLTAAVGEETHAPISWSAILAGAAASLAACVVVASVASGIGLKTAGVWGASGLTPAVFTPVAGAGLVLAQVLCFALGGYLAGRLRVKWAHVHTHEVFFRDTAHGLIAWAVATIAAAALAASWSGAAPTGPGTPMLPHEADIASEIAYFEAFALALGAFVSAVAAALGGLRRDDMHALHRAA